jgi:hypothetical protein
MWVHPRTSGTPTDALPRVPEITDTEEVTGSNPVSPTSNTLVSDLVSRARARLALGSVDLSANVVGLSLCRLGSCARDSWQTPRLTHERAAKGDQAGLLRRSGRSSVALTLAATDNE